MSKRTLALNHLPRNGLCWPRRANKACKANRAFKESQGKVNVANAVNAASVASLAWSPGPQGQNGLADCRESRAQWDRLDLFGEASGTKRRCMSCRT